MIIMANSGINWYKLENYLAGFYGQFKTSMDDSGRFALPAKLRSVSGQSKKSQLSGELVLTKGLEGCLSLYPKGEWDSVQSRLSALNFTKRDFRFFSRWFYSSAAQMTPDRSGRMVIPAHLIAEAGLKKELLIIGVNRWVEIWNPERYEYYLKQFSGSFEEVAERLFSGDEPRPE